MARVIDASVAFKWFVPEKGSEQALALLEHEGSLIAPDLIQIEVVNAMWARLRGREDFEHIVRDTATALPRMFESIAPAVDLISNALEMTIALKHPLYDCIYLALAQREQAQLVTADLNFYRKIADSPFSTLAVILDDGVQ